MCTSLLELPCNKSLSDIANPIPKIYYVNKKTNYFKKYIHDNVMLVYVKELELRQSQCHTCPHRTFETNFV